MEKQEPCPIYDPTDVDKSCPICDGAGHVLVDVPVCSICDGTGYDKGTKCACQED